MSDNPFSEPEDNDRTVFRPPTGARPVAPSAPSPPQAPAMPAPSAEAPAVLPPSQATLAGAPAMREAPARAPGAPSAGAAKLAAEARTLPKVGRSPLVAAAAPLIDLLARISPAAQGAPVGNAEALRERAAAALQAFEVEGRAAKVPEEQLRAGHYALCASIDDVALASPWGRSSSWAAHSLSSGFHQDVRSGQGFFEQLAEMQRDPGRFQPALEISYLCMALGMRGRYRLDPRGNADLDRIREGLYQVLARLNGAWERELSPHWRGVDAPHRGPGRALPTWVYPALAVSLLGLGWIIASDWVNGRGDDLQQHLVALPPANPPAVQRPPAPVATDAAVDRLRAFLAPEIQARLVVVEGDFQRLLIRIAGRDMFASGSAEVEPRFVSLLQRIGEALRSESGKVTVLGHSDNQPIRTARFPSNYELSRARAEAAKAILAGSAGQADRFSSEGRADSEPLMSNSSAEGRDTNRRIEIVLLRSSGG